MEFHNSLLHGKKKKRQEKACDIRNVTKKNWERVKNYLEMLNFRSRLPSMLFFWEALLVFKKDFVLF
jgi:hypothetical protein